MSVFHRLFCKAEPVVSIEQMREHVPPAELSFGGDADAWFWVEFDVGGTIRLERFHVEEEGIRGELNAWAAYVEASDEADPALMEQIIQTRHLITLQYPQESGDDLVRVARTVSQFLAQKMDGLYQVDDEGIYSAEGNLLASLTENVEPE